MPRLASPRSPSRRLQAPASAGAGQAPQAPAAGDAERRRQPHGEQAHQDGRQDGLLQGGRRSPPGAPASPSRRRRRRRAGRSALRAAWRRRTCRPPGPATRSSSQPAADGVEGEAATEPGQDGERQGHSRPASRLDPRPPPAAGPDADLARRRPARRARRRRARPGSGPARRPALPPGAGPPRPTRARATASSRRSQTTTPAARGQPVRAARSAGDQPGLDPFPGVGRGEEHGQAGDEDPGALAHRQPDPRPAEQELPAQEAQQDVAQGEGHRRDGQPPVEALGLGPHLRGRRPPGPRPGCRAPRRRRPGTAPVAPPSGRPSPPPGPERPSRRTRPHHRPR